MYTTRELYRNREVFIAKGAGGLDVATWSIMLGHGSWVVRGCQVAIEISCHDRVGCKVRGSRVTTKISGCDRVDCLATWVLRRDKGDFSLRLSSIATGFFMS